MIDAPSRGTVYRIYLQIPDRIGIEKFKSAIQEHFTLQIPQEVDVVEFWGISEKNET